mgnify:CR=1 FL=1|jgi:hypothetical protein
MKRIKVEDNLNLERDRSSSAIINNSETAYKQRLKQKQARKKGVDEIAEIKSELAEIKALLKKLGGN